MAITTTVYVAFDTRSGTITFTGGNDTKQDGTVTADPGPGNEITIEKTGDNSSLWQLTGISTDRAWAWVNDVPKSSILVTDDDTVPSNRAAVSYAYTVTAVLISTGAKAQSDPNIINKPAPSMTKRMGGYA
jgi:hypothetical protein